MYVCVIPWTMCIGIQVLDSSSFIFHQSAYFNLNAEKLQAALSAVGVSDNKVSIDRWRSIDLSISRISIDSHDCECVRDIL